MTISYNWLKQYLNIDLPADKAGEILTDTGLEVEGIERIESIPGGLKGVVIGQVLTCKQHPNADRLKVTTVNLGDGEPVQIVCGAPNVAAGQKVPVATVGTVLYSDGKPFEIKKGKIRGEVSLGMICAEDELGLGKGHDGILVLDADAKVGTPASDYFKIEIDDVFEIGLTPNRTDAMGHFGVARDLRAGLAQQNIVADLKWPSTNFKVNNTDFTIPVQVENTTDCPQYLGVTIRNVTVKESPSWLQNKLKAIGLKPVNNIVDVTNFVLHELGHPLHAFDADKIKGQKIRVKNFPAGTKFVTLDGIERELHPDDLMIADEEKGLCIAGVFGGSESGVSETTQNVFLEAAWFNPVSIRKTAKRHGLNTDASYRYERGVDPNLTRFALERAVSLIQEVAGGEVSSNVQESISQTFEKVIVELEFEYINRLIGNDIPETKILEILALLEFEILNHTNEKLSVAVPTYRVDVTRPADVVEEILRIYGFNRVELPTGMKIAVTEQEKLSPSRVRKTISGLLNGNGYSEMMNNSLTKLSYYKNENEEEQNKLVHILNPLSQDLGVMRQNLIFGGLEVVSHNINRQTNNIKVFEFGNTYFKNGQSQYQENEQLLILVSGKLSPENWMTKPVDAQFYHAKSAAILILEKMGISGLQEKIGTNTHFQETLHFVRGNKIFAEVGSIRPELLQDFGIDQDVFGAVLHWDDVLKAASKSKTKFTDLPKYPSVRRDLALLVDEQIDYEKLRVSAQKAGGKLVKSINLFDVYTGKNLPQGKKSYALSFILLDPEQTMVDKKTDAVMKKIMDALSKEHGAVLR